MQRRAFECCPQVVFGISIQLIFRRRALGDSRGQVGAAQPGARKANS